MNSPVLQRDKEFFAEEIKRVIKGLGLQSVEDYKEVERFGRKTALSAKQRAVVWKVYEAYQRRLNAAGCHDWQDMTLRTIQTLQERAPVTPYDDIIVDEAQDLLPIDLRAIQLFVAPNTCWRSCHKQHHDPRGCRSDALLTRLLLETGGYPGKRTHRYFAQELSQYAPDC